MLPPLSDWWSHGTRMSISLLSVLVGPKLLFTNHDWVIALFIHWSGRSTCPGWMESGEPAWRFAFWHHATTKQLSWVQPFRRRCGGPARPGLAHTLPCPGRTVAWIEVAYTGLDCVRLRLASCCRCRSGSQARHHAPDPSGRQGHGYQVARQA